MYEQGTEERKREKGEADLGNRSLESSTHDLRVPMRMLCSCCYKPNRRVAML